MSHEEPDRGPTEFLQVLVRHRFRLEPLNLGNDRFLALLGGVPLRGCGKKHKEPRVFAPRETLESGSIDGNLLFLDQAFVQT